MQPQYNQQPNQLYPPYTGPPAPRPKRHWLRHLVVLLLVFLIGVGSGIAGLIAYDDSKNPLAQDSLETSSQGAFSAYSSSANSYSLSGRIDVGDANGVDFTFAGRVDGNGASSFLVEGSSTMQKPSFEIASTADGLFFRLTNLYDTDSLAERYTHLTETETVQEVLARLADSLNLPDNLQQWYRFNDYLTQRISLLDTVEVELEVNEEISNDDQSITYAARLDSVSFEQLLHAVLEKTIGGQHSAELLLRDYGEITLEQIDVTVMANTQTGAIQSISYDGRPFNDATLNFTVEYLNQADVITPDTYQPLDSMGYGASHDLIIGALRHSESSQNDNQRLSDMKGMKLALEHYYNLNKEYPTRYNIAVNGAEFVRNQMTGASLELFTDPAGKFIGRNGSQYAYVAERVDGNQSCGGANGGVCEKYFLATTLDSGEDVQFNSEQQ